MNAFDAQILAACVGAVGATACIGIAADRLVAMSDDSVLAFQDNAERAFRIGRLAFRAWRAGVPGGDVVRLAAHAMLACEAHGRGSQAARLHTGTARKIIRSAPRTAPVVTPSDIIARAYAAGMMDRLA